MPIQPFHPLDIEVDADTKVIRLIQTWPNEPGREIEIPVAFWAGVQAEVLAKKRDAGLSTVRAPKESKANT